MYRKSYKDEHKQNQFTLTQKLNFVAKSFKISIGINIANIFKIKKIPYFHISFRMQSFFRVYLRRESVYATSNRRKT